MKTWEIWAEGYAATGESGTANLMATIQADNFDEAVELMLQKKERTDWPTIRQWYDYRPDRPQKHTIWACRLFDNETDARQTFG